MNISVLGTILIVIYGNLSHEEINESKDMKSKLNKILNEIKEQFNMFRNPFFLCHNGRHFHNV